MEAYLPTQRSRRSYRRAHQGRQPHWRWIWDRAEHTADQYCKWNRMTRRTEHPTRTLTTTTKSTCFAVPWISTACAHQDHGHNDSEQTREVTRPRMRGTSSQRDTTLQNVARSVRQPAKPCPVPPGRIRYTSTTPGRAAQACNTMSRCRARSMGQRRWRQRYQQTTTTKHALQRRCDQYRWTHQVHRRDAGE